MPSYVRPGKTTYLKKEFVVGLHITYQWGCLGIKPKFWLCRSRSSTQNHPLLVSPQHILEIIWVEDIPNIFWQMEIEFTLSLFLHEQFSWIENTKLFPRYLMLPVSGHSSTHEHPFIFGPSTRYSVTAPWQGSTLEWWASIILSLPVI